MNFNKEDYAKLTEKIKKSWVCPSCRCKEPKQGDNSNTPIHSQLHTSASKNSEHTITSPYDNVTLRAKTRPSAPVPNATAKTNSGCGCLTADIIRDIIREELDRKFNSAITDIQTKLANIDDYINFLNTEHEKVTNEIKTQKSIIDKLKNDNVALLSATRDLSHRLQQIEQLSRAHNLEIQCVPEHKSENLLSTAKQLGNTIKCPVTDSDIQYCGRIAKFNTSSPRPRSILVKFSSRRLRDTYLAAVIKFNRNNAADKLNTSHLGHGGKKCAVFVTEHLTPEAKSLHAAARLKAKQLNYKLVWVRDCKVFLRKTETSSFIYVKDSATLDKLT